MTAFDGFPPKAVAFYEGLAHNNRKEWFEAHKTDYKNSVQAPAQHFVLAMGDKLRTLSSNVIADTRLNGSGSIFRIYRDTRFSRDKSPYKSYLGILFWEGKGKKTENSGYYFHLEPPNLMLGAGVYMFTKPLLKRYRDAVVDPKLGPRLRDAVEQVNAHKVYSIGGKHYKRVPRGYDAEHQNADLLLYNGLTAVIEDPLPDGFYTASIIDYCFERFREMAPLHHWLVRMLEKA